MSEVRYSINGKYFKDFGVYVSDSDGLFDALKRKKVNSYDWAEYHGSAPDLSSPKYEQREISLKCFVVGDNWEAMKSNFDAIISEFQKAGTQRLLIEPFGLKALPYEVYMDDSISLKKTFREGKTFGTFTLKLIEPNPIKKVLYFTGDKLNLSYSSPNETEIFYGNGLKDVVKGNASLSGKVLANRVVSGYGFVGRNLLRNTELKSDMQYWSHNGGSGSVFFYENAIVINNGKNDDGVYQAINLEIGEYVLSFDSKIDKQIGGNVCKLTVGDSYTSVVLKPSTNYSRYSATFKVTTAGPSVVVISLAGGEQISYFRRIKLEKGNKATDWTPAPEDEKYIIIAGNIEEITDLTTNADKILWERL